MDNDLVFDTNQAFPYNYNHNNDNDKERIMIMIILMIMYNDNRCGGCYELV